VSGCSPATRRVEVNVFAAASLTESFQAIATSFRRSRPDVVIRFNFGPSDGLATQIAEGAPADVFAAASPQTMDAVARARGLIDRAVFARNRLVLIVPVKNEARVRAFADLGRPGVKLVVAAEGVPAGEYTRTALAKAGIARAAARNISSNEESVKGVVQKVALGEADAGVAYASDITAALAHAVLVIRIPDAFNVIATYPIAVLRDAKSPSSARAFVRFVLTDGVSLLNDFGFLPPS
jgi:molybdate transport system substrate-binding protein